VHAVSVTPTQPAASVTVMPDQASPRDGAKTMAPTTRASFSWGVMQRPSRYWSFVIVLTPLSLARMFAICMASIWWYLLPTLDSNGVGMRRTM
jgi:hypothetical protein